MNDKISVCMATYNGMEFISQQINSILKQLRSYDELIISDDGSTDGTIDIIRGFKDQRIKLLHHSQKLPPIKICKNNILVSDNFLNALNNVTGEYVFLSDQDDLWLATKVEKTLKVLKKINCGLVMSTLEVIDSNGKIIQKNGNLKKMSFWQGLIKSKYGGCTMAFDKIFLNKILPFPKYPVTHDAWIGLLAHYQNRIHFIDEPLIQYRRHYGNVTVNIVNPLWFKILYRIYYLLEVIKRTYLKK